MSAYIIRASVLGGLELLYQRILAHRASSHHIHHISDHLHAQRRCSGLLRGARQLAAIASICHGVGAISFGLDKASLAYAVLASVQVVVLILGQIERLGFEISRGRMVFFVLVRRRRNRLGALLEGALERVAPIYDRAFVGRVKLTHAIDLGVCSANVIVVIVIM